ncbi:MAG TPA: carboxypeptidase regulatory-like domain-containing protein, partial [Gemmatimonadaceae bacterium]|nr:carboxypeptidase regulatory-like domain-containing protein [Gemmatimonadaceae bacterium]
KGLVRSTPTARAATDASGQFVLCDLPGDASVDLWASAGRASTGTVRIDLAPAAVIAQSLALDAGDTIAIRGDSGGQHGRGSARLNGVVRSPAGEPIAGARVGLRNSDIEAVTDAEGHYALAELPAGTQSVVARAIGFVPLAQPVLLFPERATALDVHFDSATVVLHTVEVVGKVVFDRATLDFRKAQSRGLGYFIDRERIDARQPFDPSDLLYAVPGVHVGFSSAAGGGRTITLRGLGGECIPQYVIDGVAWPGEMYDLDNFVRTDEIAGMAVYRGIETPFEYRVKSGGSCGAIVIWTRKTGKVRKGGR